MKDTMCKPFLFHDDSMGQVFEWLTKTTARAKPTSGTALHKRVQELLQNQRNALIPQTTLDSYLLATWLEWCGEHADEMIDLTKMPTDTVFQFKHLPDIGIHVRNIVLKKPPSNTLGRLIQFSMPYIKHNRLSFPAFTTDVVWWVPCTIQITLATLLGICCEKSRKPTWTNRVLIFGCIYTLLSRGNVADMYLFCVNNLSLVRLSMIEYYCMFVSRYLPVEMELQGSQLGPNSSTLRQILLIVNQFRQDNLQQAELDWKVLNVKAQLSIEKCNRCCKNKYKLVKKTTDISQFSNADIKEALKIPRFVHPTYSKFLHTGILHRVQQIHNCISIRSLPFNIAVMQAEQIHKTMTGQSRGLLQSSCLYYCLNCRSTNVKHGFRNAGLCATCMSQNAVVKVNTIGRIVKIYDSFFYFCHICNRVHSWKSTGSEFNYCALAERNTIKCLVCNKTHGIVHWKVVDTTLGCLQHIHVCQRHSPMEYWRPYVKTLEEFAGAFREKKNKFTGY